MKIQKEALPDNQVKLIVTIDAKDVDACITKTYKDFAHKYRFPGFRPGKAPRPIIDNALGAQSVIATVTDQLVNETYPLVIDAEDLFVIGRPDFGDQEIMADDHKDLVFEVTVNVAPEYELKSYDPVEISLPSTEATQEDIDEQLKQLGEYYYDFKDAPANTKVKEGSFLQLSVLDAIDADGQRVDAFCTEERVHEIGSGIYPNLFDEQLIGLKKGDEKEFTIDMTAEPSYIASEPSDALKSVTFKVAVLKLMKKVTSEIDDAFAKETLGFESREDLLNNIKTSIEAQKAQVLPRLKETEILYALQQRLDGEVPETLVEEEERQLLQTFFQQLQQQGISFDLYLQSQDLTPDKFKEDIKKQARDVATQDAALDAWARHAKYEVTDADITEEFKKSGAENPELLEKQWRENGQLHLLRRSIKRTRAVMELMESAIVSERTEANEKPAKKTNGSTKTKKSTAKSGTKSAETAEKTDKDASKTAAKSTTKPRKTANSKKETASN